MNILIVEDEILAQEKLSGMIREYYPRSIILGALGSVKETIEYLQNAPKQPDLIFMDVELSDGVCFEIFKLVQVQSRIIITTAYDQYALNAFKVGSIDYLLKPINPQEFEQAITRAVNAYQLSLNTEKNDYSQLLKLLGKQPNIKERFTVRIGDRIVIVDTANIAYFMSEDKFTYIVTSDGHKYITDLTLDSVEEVVDPHRFFRMSRGCIASIESIKSVSKYLNGRLKVDLSPGNQITDAPIVSRQRTPQFMQWLEGDM